jgi:hypothetical protein
MLNMGMGAAKTYGEYTIGFYEGVGSSLKNTWDFVTHDAWQAKTWTEMGTTVAAITLMSGPGANPITGHLNALWLDKHLGTQFAQRQVQIVVALDQTVRDMPNWKARQWGKVVGRLAGDILTTKGAGAAAKVAVGGVMNATRATATVAEGSALFHSTARAGAAENILKGIDPKFFNPNSRFGGAFYTATSPATTVAELAHHGASRVATIQYTLGPGSRFLNLTSPVGRLGTRYIPKVLSRYARLTNKNGIVAHSLRLEGGVNVVILEDFSMLLNGTLIYP